MKNPTRVIAALILSTWAASAFAAPTTTQPTDTDQDQFIAGYASAILEHNFHLTSAVVTVKDGIVTVITTHDLSDAEKESIRESFEKIHGVKKGMVFRKQPIAKPLEHEEPDTITHTPDGGVQASLSPNPTWTFLSPTHLFDPLLADPRWPNFSAAYDRYIGRAQNNQPGQTDRDAVNVSFGESLSIVQWEKPWGNVEVGVQAAVFADFDVDHPSVDLINADYFVGPIGEYRYGDFSALVRFFHQSSHLGDNFLLNNPGIARFELSYEEPDAIVSYDLFHKSLRVYGGGGYLVDVVPRNLKPAVIEAGVEFSGQPILNRPSIIPVAAIDFQNRQQNDWSTDISARIGLQFQTASPFGRRLDLMLEYYDGHSPNGQFFLQKIQSFGIGLHFYL